MLFPLIVISFFFLLLVLLDSHVYCAWLQIEDLNQQAQMAAAEKFRDKPPAGPGDIPSTVTQPIQEESEEEEEVMKS